MTRNVLDSFWYWLVSACSIGLPVAAADEPLSKLPGYENYCRVRDGMQALGARRAHQPDSMVGRRFLHDVSPAEYFVRRST